MTIVTTRRDFLISAGATGAVLVVGFAVDGALASGAADAEINPFVRILPDGKIQVVLKHFEMGQGTSTGLVTLVAEEMDADWNKVTTDFAPADDARYKNLFSGRRARVAQQPSQIASCNTDKQALLRANCWSRPRRINGVCRLTVSLWKTVF